MSDLQMLFHKGKKGATYSWQVWTEEEEIVTEYGIFPDGKKQIARKVAEGKNIGRSNETTPAEQALREAQSMWQKKLDTGYAKSPQEAAVTDFRPMLAKEYVPGKTRLPHEFDVQPKLDGCRAVALWEGENVVLKTRGGKEWMASKHINTALEAILPKDMVLDGELYHHDLTFQQVTKLVKKNRDTPPDGMTHVSADVEFHAFDYVMRGAVDTDVPWRFRKHQLNQLFDSFDHSFWPKIKLVPTEGLTSENQIEDARLRFENLGYEGIIIRLLDGHPYLFGYRSGGLLKVKSFKDGEFRIVHHKMGRGKYAGIPTFLCVTEDNKEFECLPEGTLEQRRAYGVEPERFYGQFLKVKYQEETDDGIPRFPVGIGIRDPRDMS